MTDEDVADDVPRGEDEWSAERFAYARVGVQGYVVHALNAVATFGSQPAPNSAILAARADSDEETAYAYGAWFLMSGLDHLRALTFVMDADVLPVPSGFVLTRAAIEASARAWWLLDQHIDQRTRISRGLSERLENVRGQYNIMEGAEPKEPANLRWLRDKENTLVGVAGAKNISVIRAKTGRRKGEILGFGGPRVGHGSLVDSFLQARFGIRRKERWLYAYLSAHVHSSNSSLMDFATVRSPDGEGRLFADITPRRIELGTASMLASQLHAYALGKYAVAANHPETPYPNFQAVWADDT